MNILLVPNEPLSAYHDIDRWRDRPKGYNERGHSVVIFPTGDAPLPEMVNVIRAYKIDIVRTLEGGRWAISAAAARACQYTNVPLAVSMHGELEEIAIMRKYPEEQHRAMTQLRIIAQDAAAVIMPVQKSWCRFFAKTKYAGKVRFLPNYVQLDKFNPDLEPEDNLIMNVGRLDQDKDVMTILQAAKCLNLKMKFVGDGPMRQTVLDEGHEVIGPLRHEDIPKQMSRCRIAVFAYKNTTGFGMPVMEAQAAGRPVIVCRKGYEKPFLDEFEPAEDVSFFMDPAYRVDCTRCIADKIEILLEDKNEWNRLTQEGRKRMEQNFDRNKILDEEVAILEEVASHGK